MVSVPDRNRKTVRVVGTYPNNALDPSHCGTTGKNGK